jgi:pyridoxamine 5'-phosphate oxidase-like protein
MNPGPLPAEVRAATDTGLPCELVTCSKDGVPNTTIISKVYWLSEERVALSFQFFNKTSRNVRENPFVAVELFDAAQGNLWRLRLRYDHSETEGPVFEEMDMQIEAIASMTGMTGIFKLKAADIYDVLGWERIVIA